MDINFTDIILNTILLSIPESFIMVFIVLILLKEHDYLYRGNIKKSIVKIGLFIILPDILFTVPTFYLGIDIKIRLVINSIEQCVLVYAMVGYFGRKVEIKEHIIDIIKVYICSVISFVILITLEMSTIIIPQYIFGLEMLSSETIPFIGFLFAIPKYTVMFFIVYVNYVNINSPNSLVLNIVWKGKKLFRKFILFQVILDIFLLVIIYDKFIRNEFLINLDQEVSTFIVFLIIIIVVISNLLPWFVIYTIKLKQANVLEKNLK